MLVRIGTSSTGGSATASYDSWSACRCEARGSGDGLQPLRDLDTMRSVLSGSGPAALFDLPWMPLYLAICFAFHPLIGVTALGGAIVLVS